MILVIDVLGGCGDETVTNMVVSIRSWKSATFLRCRKCWMKVSGVLCRYVNFSSWVGLEMQEQ